MKVLIITYYWPPAGGSGVQRWLKFVKYLQNFDIEPIVYTVDNPKYPKEDKTLINEIPKNKNKKLSNKENIFTILLSEDFLYFIIIYYKILSLFYNLYKYLII